MRANTLARPEQSNSVSIVRGHAVAALAYQDAIVMRTGSADIAATIARLSADCFTQLREILISISRVDAADDSSDGSAGAVAQIAGRRVVDGFEESSDYLALLSDSGECETDASDVIDLAITRFLAVRAMLEAIKLQGSRKVSDLAGAGLVLAAGGLERAQAGRAAIAPLGLVA